MALQVEDVAAWLQPVGLPWINADSLGSAPGEQITIDLSSKGSNTGGEGQFRTPNIIITIAAASSDRLDELQKAVEAAIVADFAGRGDWPVGDPSTVVKFVDFLQSGNGWQRRPVDNADRHTAQATFQALTGTTPLE